MPEDTVTNWPRLYTGAAVAGAGVGLLVALEALPAIPLQVTAWVRSFDNKLVALLLPLTGGALFGLALAAVAQLGVVLQLRRRSKPGAS